MKLRILSITAVVALVSVFALAPLAAGHAEAKDKGNKSSLKKLKVTGTAPNGGQFTGKLSITQFGYDALKGGLNVSGVLTGETKYPGGMKVVNINQSFTAVEATLTQATGVRGQAVGDVGLEAVSPQQTVTPPTGGCGILRLTIPGGLQLNLLGLVITLAPVNLDITAVPGAGNLLGNLLCAVANLLNPDGILTNPTNLTQLIAFLQQLNNLLNLLR